MRHKFDKDLRRSFRQALDELYTGYEVPRFSGLCTIWDNNGSMRSCRVDGFLAISSPHMSGIRRIYVYHVIGRIESECDHIAVFSVSKNVSVKKALKMLWDSIVTNHLIETD